MKKALLYILLMVLTATGVSAQVPPGYVLIDNVDIGMPGSRTTGTRHYEIYTFPFVSLHPALPAANPGCTDTLPAPQPVWSSAVTGGTNRIGGGFSAGRLMVVFDKPVYGMYVMVSGLNRAEVVRVYKQNVAVPYFLSPFEMRCNTDCYASALAGPVTLNTLGEMEGPACCALGASSPYNGGCLDIHDCDGFTVFAVECSGTDGGVNVAMFFDTVRPAGCSDAIANKPCEPDTLYLGDVGDSTDATYFWVGPGGFTSTLQYPFRFPTTSSMSGVYTAYKIQTITPTPPALPYVVYDTDAVNVTVHPRAYINSISSNSPICENPLDTLHLMVVTPSVPGETYSWTGPNLFTSTLRSPDIYGFVASDSGLYKIVATTPFGCSDSATTYVKLRPNPDPPKIVGPSPYCFGDPFVPFTLTGVTSGGSVLWYTTSTGGVGSSVAPVINTSVSGFVTVYASQVEAIYCESVRDSIVIFVKPEIKPSFSWNTLLGCTTDAVTFTNTSIGANWYAWDYGDGNFSADTTTELVTQNMYKGHKIHKVTLHAYTPGCEKTGVGFVNTTHGITAEFNPYRDTFCANGTALLPENNALTIIDSTIVVQPHSGGLAFLNGSSLITPVDTGNYVTDLAAGTYLAANYVWDFGDGTVDVSNTRTPPPHTYDSGGVYTVKLTATDSIGCVDTVVHDVYAIKLFLQSFHDTMLCLSQPLLLDVRLMPKPLLADQPYSYVWTPADFLSDTTILAPYFNSGDLPDVTRTYTLTQTQTTYGCFAIDTIRIHAVIGKKLANVTLPATILYGQSIQLNSDSLVLYMWKNNDGTLNDANISNPVATPLESTVYWVYAYDKNGCLDSASVPVTVDSAMQESVPTGFTPNGDGLNDIFRPVGMKFQNLVDFRVYNRLGQQVFYSNNYKNGWDGTYNGVPQDLGTYTFVIIVARPGGEGENVVHKGTVTLIR